MVAKERKALKILGFSLFSRVRTNSAKTVGVCDRIFVGVVLTRSGGENRRILPFYCRGGNAKGDKTKGGRVHNMQAKPTQENSEFRMQNAEPKQRFICANKVRLLGAFSRLP